MNDDSGVHSSEV